MHNLWSVDFSFFYRPIRKNLYGNITATNFTYMQIFKSASKYSNKLLKIIFIKQCTIWFPIQTLYRKKTRTKFMHILTCVKSIKCEKSSFKSKCQGFPGGAVVENLPANAGDTGLSPGLGRSHMPRSD